MNRARTAAGSDRSRETSDPARRMDPRIRERRRAVMREAGRRRLRLLGYFAAAGSLAAGGWLIVTSPLLDVDHIDVQGAKNLSAAQIRRAARVGPGSALLLVDRDAVRRRIEGLAWADSARVERSLPGTLRITVVERSALAAAILADGRGYVLVDAEGMVLERRSQRPEDLPELVGFDAAPPAGRWGAPRDVLRVLDALDPTTRGRVVFAAQPGDEIVLDLDGSTEVLFGQPSDLSAKVASLEAVLARLGDRVVETVDVRVPEAPVVREGAVGGGTDAPE